MSTEYGYTYHNWKIQRRLAWPLRKDDTQNREAFHIFLHISSQSKFRLEFRLLQNDTTRTTEKEKVRHTQNDSKTFFSFFKGRTDEMDKGEQTSREEVGGNHCCMRIYVHMTT